MHRIDYELIGHAPQCVKDEITEKTSLHMPVTEVIEEHFYDMVKEVEMFGVVDLVHELRVRAIEPHYEANPE